MSVGSAKPLTEAYKGLLRYVPKESFEKLIAVLEREPITLKVVNGRATKLGDYRPKWIKTGKPLITVNRSLNSYAFLITLVHELAHHHTYLKYAQTVKPHGEEWKQVFIGLANEVMLGKEFLPNDVEQALHNYFQRTFASSCADSNLQRVLANYDELAADEALLENLPIESLFEINGKVFKKGEPLRKRFRCLEVATKKMYLVNSVCRVRIV